MCRPANSPLLTSRKDLHWRCPVRTFYTHQELQLQPPLLIIYSWIVLTWTLFHWSDRSRFSVAVIVCIISYYYYLYYLEFCHPVRDCKEIPYFQCHLLTLSVSAELMLSRQLLLIWRIFDIVPSVPFFNPWADFISCKKKTTKKQPTTTNSCIFQKYIL